MRNRWTSTELAARNYLSRAYRIDRFIDNKLEEVMRLRAIASQMTRAFGGERVSRTRNKTPMEDALIKVFMAESDINLRIDELIDIKREIGSLIQIVPDPDCRLLLEMRYLCFNSWEEIAVKLRFSCSYAHRLHRRALNLCAGALSSREVANG